MNVLKAMWKGFYYWRKRYMPIRVIVLLLIFSEPLIESVPQWNLIRNLFWIACRAIRYQSEPKIQYQEMRYRRSLAVKQLQISIRKEVTARKLQLGDTQRQLLAMRPGRVNLDHIADLAQKLQVVPVALTAHSIRKDSFYAGQAAAEDFFNPPYREIYAEIFRLNWNTNFSRENLLTSWNCFVYFLQTTLFPAPYRLTFVWFSFLVLISFWLSKLSRHAGIYAALILNLFVMVVCYFVNYQVISKSPFWFAYLEGLSFTFLRVIAFGIYLSCFAVFAGMLGEKLYEKLKEHQSEANDVSIIVAGLLLFCFPAWLSNPTYLEYLYYEVRLLLWPFSSRVPAWQSYSLDILGVVLLVYGVWKLVKLYKSRRRGCFAAAGNSTAQ